MATGVDVHPVGGRRLLVARVAWLAVYPSALGLVVVAMLARFGDRGAGTTADDLLRPGGGAYAAALLSLEIVVVLWFVGNTLLMAWRGWRDWVALYVSVGGNLYLAFTLPAVEVLASVEPQLTGAVVSAQWLGAAMPVPFLYFFPDGRFVPRRAWIVVPAWLVVWGLSAVLSPAGHGVLSLPPTWLAIWLAFGTVGLGSQLYRFRSAAGPLMRQQIKWVLAGDCMIVTGILLILPARFLGAEVPSWLRAEVTLPLYLTSLAAFAAAFTMAILRYRLWDIDLLINRTLVYGATSAGLLMTYVVSVLALGSVVRLLAGSGEIAVAGSTLVVVLAFQPLRQRIQRAVDRRFYRSRYDAARTLDAFSARLRDEVDLDALSRELVAVVSETVHPAHAGLWLRKAKR